MSCLSSACRLSRLACLLPALLASLAGCDMLGIESPEKMAAVREAEGRAVGGACRHAGRAIEDCYALNRKADKAAVFAGWREMNDYMRENNLEAVPPKLVQDAASAVASDAGDKEDRPSKSEGKGKSAHAS